MTKLLTITADREDYCTELKVRLHLDEFGGIGSSYFNNETLDEFCLALQEVAKTMQGEAELVGEGLSLRAYPLDRSKINGTVGVYVALSEEAGGTYSRKEEMRQVSGELQSRNHHIATFADDLATLKRGDLDEVCLYGDNRL